MITPHHSPSEGGSASQATKEDVPLIGKTRRNVLSRLGQASLVDDRRHQRRIDFVHGKQYSFCLSWIYLFALVLIRFVLVLYLFCVWRCFCNLKVALFVVTCLSYEFLMCTFSPYHSFNQVSLFVSSLNCFMICNCHAYLLTQYPCSLQVLPMGMGKVLQTKGTQVPYHHSGTPKSRKVPSQCDPQPEIQCAHLPTNGKKKVSFFVFFCNSYVCLSVLGLS